MFNNQNFKAMKTNVQITASKKEFKNGQSGYEVKVDGMEGKLDCKMNFTNPLKAMRYMFLLSKRLELQVDKVQLTALSLAYQRAKEAEQKAIEDATGVANEVAQEAEQESDEQAPAEENAESPKSLFQDEEQSSSPILKQFDELKAKHPDAVLLFRCGDFYESYREDAEACAEILGITLTKYEDDNLISTVGFPHQALDTYLPKLIRAGKRVAICDELEDKKPSKKEGVTELITPNNDTNTEGAA